MMLALKKRDKLTAAVEAAAGTSEWIGKIEPAS